VFARLEFAISESLENRFIEAIQSFQLRVALWQMEEGKGEFAPDEQQKISEASTALRTLDEEVSSELTRLTLALKAKKISVNMAGPAQPDRVLHVLKFEIPLFFGHLRGRSSGLSSSGNQSISFPLKVELGNRCAPPRKI